MQRMSDVSLTSSFEEIPSRRCESNRSTGLLAHSAYNKTIVEGDDIIHNHSVIYLKHINVKALLPRELSVVRQPDEGILKGRRQPKLGETFP